MFKSLFTRASALAIASSASILLSSVASASQVDCTGIEPWDPHVAYPAGSQMTDEGSLYQANWWVLALKPSTRAGQWSEYTLIGECAADVPLPHEVVIEKELMITDLSVVESEHAKTGALSFQHLISNMTPVANPTNADMEAFVMDWLNSFTVEQIVNGDRVAPRNNMGAAFIDPWREGSLIMSNGASNELNFDAPVFRLLAVTYRPDLATRDAQGNVTSAGEARFTFGFTNGVNGSKLPAKVIFEYGLDANSEEELQAWMNEFHALGAMEFGEAYNQKLIALTNKFTLRNSSPSKPNGNSINQVRTNEIPFGGIWELREFKLSAETGLLEPNTIALTPRADLNGSATLANFINGNESAILSGELTEIPTSVERGPFAGASTLMPFGRFGAEGFWNAPGINNPEARHIFSLNTCNGCHAQEAGITFNHIVERDEGVEAALSDFLTGVDAFSGFPHQVSDPTSPGVIREFSELADRKFIFTCMLENCAGTQAAPESAPALIESATFAAPLSARSFSVESAPAEQTDAERFEELMKKRRGRAH